MTPKQIINKVRMAPAIGDNQGSKFSDYQIIDALDNVLSMVYNTSAASSSSVFNKVVSLHLKGRRAELPDDFLRVVEVRDDASGAILRPLTGYRISGNTLTASSNKVTLEYKPFYDDSVTMDTVDDDLDLPAYFQNLLVKYTTVMLLGTTTQDADIIQQITTDIWNIVAGREYSSLPEPELPWKL